MIFDVYQWERQWDGDKGASSYKDVFNYVYTGQVSFLGLGQGSSTKIKVEDGRIIDIYGVFDISMDEEALEVKGFINKPPEYVNFKFKQKEKVV